jgi:uridine phosphorylase
MVIREFRQAHVHVDDTPIMSNKFYASTSVFAPESLLREARRQKGLQPGTVPAVCVLDPDGDLVDYLQSAGLLHRQPTWACYHTTLYTFHYQDSEFGIIGRTVGSSFAVLVAEELFVSGCQLLISIISAGQIVPLEQPPYVVLIERALRDEGTSYHYLPPSPYSALCPHIKERLLACWDHERVPLYAGTSWTTDAPFRETEEMIALCRERGILTVEMEAAALYAFAEAKSCSIVCFAHVTNCMGRIEGDFEKGEAAGSHTALHVISQAARLL